MQLQWLQAFRRVKSQAGQLPGRRVQSLQLRGQQSELFSVVLLLACRAGGELDHLLVAFCPPFDHRISVFQSSGALGVG